jgi:hypothetical protein
MNNAGASRFNDRAMVHEHKLPDRPLPMTAFVVLLPFVPLLCADALLWQ